MKSHKLQNYLKTFRKRTGLSQRDVAYLLGCRSGAKISRYERFARTPNPQTILAYEIVFGVPAKDLFAGIHGKVERMVLRRAKQFEEKLGKTKPNSMTIQKQAALRELSARISKHDPIKFNEPQQ